MDLLNQKLVEVDFLNHSHMGVGVLTFVAESQMFDFFSISNWCRRKHVYQQYQLNILKLSIGSICINISCTSTVSVDYLSTDGSIASQTCAPPFFDHERRKLIAWNAQGWPSLNGLEGLHDAKNPQKKVV